MSDRTHAPTPKRRREAARDGDVLQSRELGVALVTGVGALGLITLGGAGVRALGAMLARGLTIAPGTVRDFDPGAALLAAVGSIAIPLGLLFAATLFAAFAGPAILGAWGFRGSSVRPKFERLNPVKGLGRIFGIGGAAELAKSLAKVLVIAGGGALLLKSQLFHLLNLATLDPHSGAIAAGSLVTPLVGLVVLLFALIALIDVPWQKHRRDARLMMTTDEIRREQRESDGAPELKRARRDRQYQLATLSARRGMKDATVVLTNPTHFAVALRYRPDRDAAPVVVARGMDEGAAAIRDLARANDVPLLDYPALTRAIYFTSRAGQPVREDLYLAVATVLAFVLSLERAMAAGRAQPEIELPQALRYGADGRCEV